MGGFTMMGSTAQTVPSAPSSSAPDSFAQELIKNISTPISPELIHAAVTPVPGAHAAQVPSSLQTPVGPAQQQPFDRRPVVGRHNAKMQGIGNAITGVTNGLGAVVTAEAQTKQNTLRDHATKAIMAQQAIDEATQAHEAALANNDAAAASKAQEQILKNKDVLAGVFADPKIRKGLVKGFDISYTDPESNKTPEHDAVKAAMAQAKTMQEKRQIMKAQQEKQNAASGQAAAEAFSKQLPQGMTANVQAQQQLATAQAQQKINQETLKDYMQFKASVYRSDRTVDAASLRQMGSAMLEQQRLATAQDRVAQQFQNALKMQGIRYSDQLHLIGARAAEARKTAQLIRQDKEADPLTIYNSTRKAGQTYERNYMADGKTLEQLQQQRLSMYVDSKGGALKPNDADVKQLDAHIAMVQQQVQLDKANADNFQKQANQLQSIYGLKEGGEGDGESTGTSPISSTDDAAGTNDDSDDYSDPGAYN